MSAVTRDEELMLYSVYTNLEQELKHELIMSMLR
jgi:hypothetical protein